ncbi:SulP family inorganic anion transporter [Campylobacter ureolyticus]|nr:SulP family inorganic anion transporter [Campylobacter ureolyticus]MCR8684443.1 hypothetical protein [Campylobacter ureolyticus]QQY34993.1 hypothetical protein I6I59_05540 [Campylobacter ureolyticus]SUX20946.1 Putative sulfate transporter ychM [Campylobacter ureolyticus]
MKDFIPEFFISLKKYNFKMFLNDMAAGIIVAIVALPLSIALGIASGVTPEACYWVFYRSHFGRVKISNSRANWCIYSNCL